MRPHTPLTAQWLAVVEEHLDAKRDDILAFPSPRARCCFPTWNAEGYPVRWSELMNEALHPLMYKYLHNVRAGLPCGMQILPATTLLRRRACHGRSNCANEVAARFLAAARRTETRVRVFGCGTCEACKEYAQSREGCSVLWNSKPHLPWNGKRKPLDAMGPHELKRSRSKYQDCVSC